MNEMYLKRKIPSSGSGKVIKTNMSYPYCAKFGFDNAVIRSRLQWLDLGERDQILAKQLHDDIIVSEAQGIIDDFYTYLQNIDEAKRWLTDSVTIERLKKTQMAYLLSLGIDFTKLDYFESRLRIGQAHARVGLSLSLYQCAYRLLTQLIIDRIPVDNDVEEYQELCGFIYKMTALDMSLAIETYHFSQVKSLEESLGRAQVKENQLRIKASTDKLTGFLNHEYILNRLRQTIEDDAKVNKPTSLMMADLDHFKQVNDNYGHLVGDKVLMEVARRLGTAVRDFDVLGRYGGEEFLIVLKGTPLSTALMIADRIRTHVAAGPISLHGGLKIETTISIGVATRRPDDDADEFIRRADEALYVAKSAGRNCVRSAD
jgi:diguanylate cyclase (GGDEF)-like protein